MNVTYKEEIDRKTVETLQNAVADYEAHKITKRDFRMIYRGVYGAVSGLTEWENLDCDFGDVNDRLYFVDFGFINWSKKLYKRRSYCNYEKDPTVVWCSALDVQDGKTIRNDMTPTNFNTAQEAYALLNQKRLETEAITRQSGDGRFPHIMFTNNQNNLDD